MPRNKKTRPLAGPALKKYLRDAIDAETDASSDPGRRIVDLFAREIAEARVRMPIPARRRSSSGVSSPASPEPPEIEVGAPAEVPPRSPVNPVAAHATTTSTTAPLVSVSNSAAPPVEAFDPYAFSVVALLTKKGKDAVLHRLGEIDSAAHLKLIAEVQHLAVAADVDNTDDLRAAIIAGAERRIADRRAAAS